MGTSLASHRTSNVWPKRAPDLPTVEGLRCSLYLCIRDVLLEYVCEYCWLCCMRRWHLLRCSKRSGCKGVKKAIGRHVASWPGAETVWGQCAEGGKVQMLLSTHPVTSQLPLQALLQQTDLCATRSEASCSAHCRLECRTTRRVPWLDRQREGLPTTLLSESHRQQHQHCQTQTREITALDHLRVLRYTV